MSVVIQLAISGSFFVVAVAAFMLLHFRGVRRPTILAIPLLLAVAASIGLFVWSDRLPAGEAVVIFGVILVPAALASIAAFREMRRWDK